jgi:hypothetical protein
VHFVPFGGDAIDFRGALQALRLSVREVFLRSS